MRFLANRLLMGGVKITVYDTLISDGYNSTWTTGESYNVNVYYDTSVVFNTTASHTTGGTTYFNTSEPFSYTTTWDTFDPGLGDTRSTSRTTSGTNVWQTSAPYSYTTSYEVATWMPQQTYYVSTVNTSWTTSAWVDTSYWQSTSRETTW